MTRINVVPVSELCDQHLLAEHRELTRIPNGILSGKLKVHYDDRPSEYTLGKGHVKFFTDKVAYLYKRYLALYKECVKRGFKVSFVFPSDNESLDIFLEKNIWRTWHPDADEEAINRARIKERWPKNARYYGKPITKE